MSWLQHLAEKPWIPQAAGVDLPNHSIERKLNQARTASRFFIAVVSVIFFLFIITYLSRTQFPDFQALAGEPWQPFTEPGQLWVNSGFILFAGICLHWSYLSAKKNQLNTAIFGLSCAVFFSLLFIGGQLLVWRQLIDMGYFIHSNPANSFFYLFTSIHGIHLIGGILALVNITQKFIRKNSLEKLTAGLGLCTTYWHFLFLVWILLFALLTSTSETYNAIALLCGF